MHVQFVSLCTYMGVGVCFLFCVVSSLHAAINHFLVNDTVTVSLQSAIDLAIDCNQGD